MKLTTDAVLLADFADASGCRRGADLGCASGILMLLTLWKNPDLYMTGLELLPEAVRLTEQNLKNNGLEDRGRAVLADLRERGKGFQAGAFDFIIANPPYFRTGDGKISPDDDRATARGECRCSLEDICRTAAVLCRSGGRFALCYRPERFAELLETVRKTGMEPKRLRCVHHSCGHAASLLLLECRRDGKPGLKTEPPLILFDSSGRETDEYRRIYHH
ncbi:MAG: methyltransferase [Oscillospiraceae bacterium]|nr:methyltransferase [Oscillospiraceae bacterium]